jgi:membrane protein
LGITSILVTGKETIPTTLRNSYAKNRSSKKSAIRPLMAWLKLLWRRIDEDHMTTLAGNLAYVSLLSLVPLIAVVFALFSAFPMFAEVSGQIRHFIFANFIPATGDVIQGYIEQFVANSSRMTAVGAFGLIVTSLLLMYSIDSALNTIWRSTRTRPKIYSFAVYWMILTLGPLLAGASLAISSYLLSLRWASDLNSVIDDVLRLFPLILSWTAFWLLYSIVPTTQVRNRDAIIGALVAALLFEAVKKRLPYISRVPVISADLRRASRGAYFVCLGVLDVVYRLAWGRNYCHSRGIPQT